MLYEEKYLKLLIGKSVTATDSYTNFVIPRDKELQANNNYYHSISESTQLIIEEYGLDLINPFIITPSVNDINDLTGLVIVDTHEYAESAELVFNNGSKLILDMRDEVYTGPEAMVLHGPNFLAVWQ